MTHPIEVESYKILRSRLDLGHLGEYSRHIVERVVHATADLALAETMIVSDEDVLAGIDALRQGAPVLCDVEMVRAGISSVPALTFLDEARNHINKLRSDDGERNGRMGSLIESANNSEWDSTTMSAAAIRLAARQFPVGAILVVGCAPTALFQACDLINSGEFRPSLIIGLPVGFVGAAASKACLRACSIPSISNEGERGGSAPAAAAFNALLRMANKTDI
ncbi:MAG TPA: precorrin-8X methylmutase [Acidimicrobiales bacterium]|nr:precorrin-8X methylmutase [Acidimicrobiales bacterium]